MFNDFLILFTVLTKKLFRNSCQNKFIFSVLRNGFYKGHNFLIVVTFTQCSPFLSAQQSFLTGRAIAGIIACYVCSVHYRIIIETFASF